ncbi:Rossmann-fold NAD(P)-binding domain-containing protein [Nitrincola iocasae]|uniref:SDR family NAD(P)-dependent oxidoreductase n=1 Tax=Nitrincola iocasae TaxID=2614693 RepID=A0A5J6LHT3_9GAMM|nr:SDR family NAD(P)-dependent oxidoreductase [Nitrincola iocasae]QEW07846.1 SDR family NAD(P)-dependent oxidoreductase [Nitrincola iocasae]
MQQKTLLLVGLGDLGGRIAYLAVQQGLEVQGMRRGTDTPPGVTLIQHDAASPWPDLPCAPDDVVLCLSPSGSGVAAYQQAYLEVAQQAAKALRDQAPAAHVWLISSTGVYGQSGGEWVDEQAERCPSRDTARVLLETEDYWLAQPQPVTLLRPSGLYGPGRYYLQQQARQGVLPPSEPPIYTNRIHIDDAARAVMHLINCRQQGKALASAYNLTDTCPASLHEVLSWLQQQLGVEARSTVPIHRDSKRICHQRLKASGFVWHYPDYRAGYSALLSQQA